MIDWLSIYNLLIIGVYINISTVCSISIAEEKNILQVCNEWLRFASYSTNMVKETYKLSYIIYDRIARNE